MRDVMVLGGRLHGVSIGVDDKVDFIEIEKKPWQSSDWQTSDETSREHIEVFDMKNIEYVKYTILRLYSGKWVCVNLNN